MQIREGDKLKVIRFPWSSTVVTTSTSVTSADVNTVFSGFAVHLHSRSLPVKDSSTERAADAPRNRVSEQAAGIKCGVLDWHCVTNHILVVREGDITQSRAKSLVLRKLQLRQSCRWNVTVFAENVSDSITQVRCKVRLTLGSQEIDPDHVSVMSVKATNLKSYGFLVLCNSFNSNSRSVTSAGVNTLTLDSQCVPIIRSLPVKRYENRVSDQASGINVVFWIRIASPILFLPSVKTTKHRVVQIPGLSHTSTPSLCSIMQNQEEHAGE